ncbi:MAG: hypothetical protein K0U68_06980 [Gammaproteobacteria bacterium]|nr:hypothetical protein [Gammaproteobacteria bacterium]
MNNKHQLKLTQLIPLLACLGSAPTIVTADIVHLDDTIITFSLCTGNDCVNGESFGFDTMRLKENNLRMHFNDTSTSASFPTNDWRFIFNDTSNGGSNYFALEDSTAGRQPFRVDAGAPANALRVDSAGDVGIGESNPVVELHVADGDSPTLRLEQDGSSGFTSQTWDIVSNEANFFIRDVTNGSQLPFRIKPGADTDALFIAADNNIGMGTDSPQSALHLRGTGAKQIRLESTDNNAIQMRLISGVSNHRRILARNNGDSATLTQIQLGDSSIVLGGPNINSDNWLTISSAGIVTTGAGACNPGPCDAVFNPKEFQVESITEHAEYMWSNKHLWGVGPTIEGEPINLTKKTAGILHELEKAHIYIEQLHSNIKHLETRLAKLETQDTKHH